MDKEQERFNTIMNALVGIPIGAYVVIKLALALIH